MTEHLTQRDVERLLADPSPETRAEMAAKVAASLESVRLTDGERKLAEGIVRVMARDAAERVRQALAENLKSSQSLPRDVSPTLARRSRLRAWSGCWTALATARPFRTPWSTASSCR